MAKDNKSFARHFRLYFRNNHPAYIVDEEGNKYVFHRVTHSNTSGGKKNWKKPNPLLSGDNQPMHIVKQEQRDLKNRFSKFKLETKPGVNISYPEIKKARTCRHEVALDLRSGKNIKTSKTIKRKTKKASEKK